MGCGSPKLPKLMLLFQVRTDNSLSHRIRLCDCMLCGDLIAGWVAGAGSAGLHTHTHTLKHRVETKMHGGAGLEFRRVSLGLSLSL